MLDLCYVHIFAQYLFKYILCNALFLCQERKWGVADNFAKKNGGSPTLLGNRKGVATKKRLGTTVLDSNCVGCQNSKIIWCEYMYVKIHRYAEALLTQYSMRIVKKLFCMSRYCQMPVRSCNAMPRFSLSENCKTCLLLALN